mmetsp:Transcript_7374/g.24310  ORF Transcript_7374/g.24310 Transcript_7374/m.24310 type:complete len:158 (-) Transcript_7374:1017-1490(-)
MVSHSRWIYRCQAHRRVFFLDTDLSLSLPAGGSEGSPVRLRGPFFQGSFKASVTLTFRKHSDWLVPDLFRMTMFFRNASEPAKEVPAPKKKKVKCCPFWPVVPATLEEDEPEKATCESRTERAKAKALVTAKSRAADPRRQRLAAVIAKQSGRSGLV